MASTLSHNGVDHIAKASTLIRQLVNENDPKYGFGSMTCSIYDTAWVSMVAKTTNGQTRWLFQSSFQYLLNHQKHDGGWQNDTFDNDGILNSLAALLALCKHIRQPYQIEGDLEDLKHRKSRAIYFLETKFSSWTVDSTVTRSTLQPLIAKLLQMLEWEGLQFSFAGRELFLDERGRGNTNCNDCTTCGDLKTAATGLSEGRAGEIDIDRVGQHKILGSIMASPASTAAYLMDCSTWDDEAEAYLIHIVSLGGSQSGGVPTKFPTTIFEMTGAITVLLANGFSLKDLGSKSLETAATYLEDRLQLQSGVTEFARYVEANADNTAKTISALCLLGQAISPHSLNVRYEAPQYLKTCTQERIVNFSTNCHILKALLDLLPGDSEQMSQIETTVRFLCNCWWTTNGMIEDQLNSSANYPIMLMVEAFMQLLELWEKGRVPILDDRVIRDKVIISLFQALIRILQTQNVDGSWEDGGCEVTAYAIISLTKLTSLSSATRIKHQVSRAIESGRSFLSTNFPASTGPDHVWTGKVRSGSSTMYQAYVLAAIRAPVRKQQTRSTIESHCEIPLARMTIQTKYFARQAWFVGVPEWLVQACLIESHLLLPQVRAVRHAVFPSDKLVDDRYFESIPFAWIVANNMDKRFIGAETVLQMTILTVLGRHFEEYMERVVRKTFAGCFFEVEDIVYSIFQDLAAEDKHRCFCDSYTNGTTGSSRAIAISDVHLVLYGFISHVLTHPHVLIASSQDQGQLRSEFLSFLIGRVSQLSGEQGERSATDKTPLPYTFAFLTCLVGKQHSIDGVGPRGDFLCSPEQHYLAADFCRHISIISFMSTCNDEQQAALIHPAPILPNGISPSSQHTPSRSISPASTSSSSYDDCYSPISLISSVSSAPGGSPLQSLFSKPATHQPVLSPIRPSQETLQMTRLLRHERHCLDLCFDSLTEAGIVHSTMDVMKLFADFHALAEHIYRDPNIGSTYQPFDAHDDTDLTCTLKPPPVPSKRRRGSVAAARAGLTAESPVTRQPYRQEIGTQRSLEGLEWTKAVTQTEQTIVTVPLERDRSWNKLPVVTKTRTAQASSEVSRIESIMSEIDGIKLGFGSKVSSRTQRRTASESNAARTQFEPKFDAQERLTKHASPDAEDMKLAKARLETQRRLGHDTHRRKAKDVSNNGVKEAARQPRLINNSQTKTTEEINEPNIKRRVPCPSESAGWVRAPPPESSESVEARARKLHRASRLGGPRWKAPF